MSDKMILLVEDNPDDEELTTRALRQAKIANEIVVARDGADPRTRLIPTVIRTSSSEDEDMLKSYQLGANSYVRKPVDFSQFATAVSQLGMYWLLLNQPVPKH